MRALLLTSRLQHLASLNSISTRRVTRAAATTVAAVTASTCSGGGDTTGIHCGIRSHYYSANLNRYQNSVQQQTYSTVGIEEEVNATMPGPVAEALIAVRDRVTAASVKAEAASTPRLVAVSKTKPVEMLLDA